MADPVRVGVLASGGGSNFQALLDKFGGGGREGPGAAAEIVGLIASRDTAGVLDRACRAGVSTAVSPPLGGADESDAKFLLGTLERWRCRVVVLAGYLRLVPEPVIRAYPGRIINIHPALLPAFGGEGMFGARVHEAVLAAGVRITGATVHFVDEAYDRGPVICQWPVRVLTDDTPESVAARVLEVEHVLLPSALEALVLGHVSLTADGRASWTREWFESERFETGKGEWRCR